jgi:formylglycine-generating enzyme required for sulfatase activity
MTDPIPRIVAAALTLLAGPAAVLAATVSLQPGAVFRDCPDCPALVVIPAGVFIMGSTPQETTAAAVREDIAPREWPARRISIDKPFAIGRYEITRDQYESFVQATGRAGGDACITWNSATGRWENVVGASWQRPGFAQTGDHPVGCLDLADAQAYVTWLSERTGERYRIPTEAEWEYVARAGTTTMQTWGDSFGEVCRYANASDLSRAEAHGGLATEPTRFFSCRDGFVYTAPVGSFPPNPFGLYDVIGNIWEWVQDCYFATYEGAPGDSSAWLVDGCERRVVRGGGWYSRVWFVRPAGRSREEPEYRSMTLGLRVLRELP